MARILTYPERVTHHNIEKLRQCVNNGSYKYPGARMVTYPDGSSKSVFLLLPFKGRQSSFVNDVNTYFILQDVDR